MPLLSGLGIRVNLKYLRLIVNYPLPIVIFSMFQFKQFKVDQDKTAMKVGTDGVLLGAWTPVNHNPYAILDIGTGTGLVALMLAQRTHAEQIDALEIDADAHEQATENFENSPWNDRLFCFHASLDEFMDDLEDEE